MKKNFLTLVTIIAVNATVSAQMRFGIKGGLNIASITSSLSSNGRSSLIGFHAGVVLDYPLSKSISIQPNLLFSQKGETVGVSTITTVSNNYLDVPINVMYKATNALSIGGGPYVGYAISNSVSSGGQTINYGFTSDSKRFDYGVNITVGYEVISGFILSANYSLGVANLSKFSGSTLTNNVIGFSVTKLFGKK